ncbi:unnamed protein product [Sphagnum tenellum]
MQIWRRGGKEVDKPTAEHLFEVINAQEEVLRRLIRKCAYLKYVEARLGDRTLYADEILRDGFCINMIDIPLCPFKVVTNLQEAVWDADIVVNILLSTETRPVFQQIGHFWREGRTMPVIISLAKGVEAALQPQMVVLGLGGCIIHVCPLDFDNCGICLKAGNYPAAHSLRTLLDLTTHEVMGGLKNVYAIGAGMAGALTNESATSKAVYFAHCTSKMIYITHLLAEQPERLAGPLLANTLLKGRNAWYGEKLAKGELKIEMGDNISGKLQGVLAVEAFHELLRQPSFSVMHLELNKPIAPVELCPILRALYKILIQRNAPPGAIL